MTAFLVSVCVAAAGADYRGPVKEVLIVHHSHLDVGYTHPQPMLWELQKDFLTQALNVLDETAAWPAEHQPRWTCEATAPVMRWLDEAGPADVERFKKYLQQERLAISALEYNTTPLCSAEGLARHLYAARALSDRFGVRINVANTHDVTGLPWTIVDLLLDSDVELLIMGINLHLGGTPLPRPAVYRWRGPSGRELFVLNGEHYSMFDQWAEPAKRNLDTMAQGLEKYLTHLESLKYPHDFAYLTATCAPQAYDNSPPNAELPRLVRQWNEAGRQPRLRFVTPPELLKRIRALPRESLPVVSGDWTDYWNFGAASSAWETRLARQGAADLTVIDLLQAFSKPDARLAGITRRVWDDVNLYNEHTWGAAASLNPDFPNVIEQWALKAHPAYESRSLAEYVQVRQLQRLAQNPNWFRKQEGVLVVNPTASPVRHAVSVPPLWRLEGKRIESGFMRGREAHRQPDPAKLCGPVELEPFSWRVVPIKQLKPVAPSPDIKTGADFMESPHHRLAFDPATGGVTALLDKQRNWQVLDPASAWGFFQLVHEKPDPRVEPSRKAFHVRSVENERVGLTGWKTNWVAALSSYTGKVSCRVVKSPLAATLVLTGQAEGLTNLEQRITLRADS
ncbi:MAG: hypothetical protein FJ388_18410, partial [Verrucomicrobia bacterium]|nr:hypothetical protein [Verrucomicrobiota bacterium]